ncbi:MAG: SMI1/KNR4 family protein [Methyloversatilis discipulorum]|uniref:SMI1/KNR4 family protein n=1 Tax=Methyloversatilis discipulorum TaxID=1119528 RepID=UPI0026ED8073|nr:SMI1/KNR4 family protein [Methyloversatilis discipulorum]MBT9518424.1 SMI1/KNR4 family protein [Methyloversatilis discipulorum]
MTISMLRKESEGKLEFFPPASSDKIHELTKRFHGFSLTEYIAFLHESNGVGELFSEGSLRFVRNMILFDLDEALHWSQAAYQDSHLVIGAPGVDGIFFVLDQKGQQVFAHMPIDNEFVKVADSVFDLLSKSLAGELRL